MPDTEATLPHISDGSIAGSYSCVNFLLMSLPENLPPPPQSPLPTVRPRQDHAIRSQPEYRTSWYHAEGLAPVHLDSIDQLHLLPSPRSGDLLLHWYNGDPQIFLCEVQGGNSNWTEIQRGYTHPHLSTHKLHIGGSGTPTWVKRATVTTYGGAARRRKSSKPQCQR
jgi:hypothetical protein